MVPPPALPPVNIEKDQPPSVVAKLWSEDVAQCNVTSQQFWELQDWMYQQTHKK